MTEPTEFEKLRQGYLRALDESAPGWREDFAPGTFGCHEAMDRTSLMIGLVDDLATHPGVVQHPEWFAIAQEAVARLSDLYQAIGAAHLNKEDKSGSPANPT